MKCSLIKICDVPRIPLELGCGNNRVGSSNSRSLQYFLYQFLDSLTKVRIADVIDSLCLPDFGVAHGKNDLEHADVRKCEY